MSDITPAENLARKRAKGLDIFAGWRRLRAERDELRAELERIAVELEELQQRHVKMTRYDERMVKDERRRAGKAEAALARVEAALDARGEGVRYVGVCAVRDAIDGREPHWILRDRLGGDPDAAE